MMLLDVWPLPCLNPSQIVAGINFYPFCQSRLDSVVKADDCTRLYGPVPGSSPDQVVPYVNRNIFMNVSRLDSVIQVDDCAGPSWVQFPLRYPFFGHVDHIS
jgi:hypothetical protein